MPRKHSTVCNRARAKLLNTKPVHKRLDIPSQYVNNAPKRGMMISGCCNWQHVVFYGVGMAMALCCCHSCHKPLPAAEPSISFPLRCNEHDSNGAFLSKDLLFEVFTRFQTSCQCEINSAELSLRYGTDAVCTLFVQVL